MEPYSFTTLIRSCHRYTVALIVCGAFVFPTVQSAADEAGATARCTEDAMLVFDASGSMASTGYNELETPRMHQALTAVRRVLPEVAKLRRIGLLVYGPGPRDACHNIDLKMTPQPDAAARIISALESVTPDGNTPLTDAVSKAADVLKFKERPGTVVLVTDGDETCGGAPCQTARRLTAEGADLTVHVIGFKVRGKFFQWRSQAGGEGARTAAKCLADISGGEYISTETIDELIAALRETLGCPLLTQQNSPKMGPRIAVKTNVQPNNSRTEK